MNAARKYKTIRTGLLFGSFNPVHIGHIAIAAYMKEFAGMEEIWFIVSPKNPFKRQDSLADPADRLEMVKLAIEPYKSFRASDVEFGMPVPSYTYDTMQKLTVDFPGREFSIITGTDNIGSIRKWKDGDKLIAVCDFLVYPRPESDAGAIEGFISAKLVKAPMIDVSSSFIRRSLSEGRDMRAFVPGAAYDFIEKKGLYR